MSVRIRRLKAEIASDRRNLGEQLDVLRGLRLDGPPFDDGELARAAIALHHGYGAVEAILQRVARTIEGEVPTGNDWHQALLATMALDIPGVRPSMISTDTLDELRHLLAFRHFFRHAYAARLDGRRLRERVQGALMLQGPLDRDLDALDAYLDALIAADES